MKDRRKEEPGFEAFPAVVIADKTDKRGKRLGFLSFSLLILFFGISAYVQSAKNATQLERANRERSLLIKSSDRVTRTLDQQTQLIIRLQAAIQAQNEALRKAGLDPVPVPGISTSSPNPRPTPGVRPTPWIFPRPTPTTPPRPGPKSSPKPSPKPTTSPSPTPLVPIDDVLCELTGICV